MAEKQINKQLFEEAKKYFPGGVNSPVRSFKAVGGEPVFIRKAKGSKLYSADGREFIDYCLGFGSSILGHGSLEVKNGTCFGANTEQEIELAKIIVEAIPSIEQIRFTNSGAEAASGAVRLALAFSKKDKVLKFEGCYHGTGILNDIAERVVEAPFNDLKAVEKNVSGVGAVIIEPIAGNMGVILPKEGFLKGLREICNRYNIVLIFDEVITAFRFHFGGVQSLFNVKPDITCLGKIIGGGLPVGAFGGRRESMSLLSPEGTLPQAGTFSGNLATVSSGIRALKKLKESGPYPTLEKRAERLCKGIELSAKEHEINAKVNRFGSMFSVFFTGGKVVDCKGAKGQNVGVFGEFFHGMLDEGIYFSPSPFEANFVSAAHSAADIERTLKAVENVFDKMNQ